MSATKRKLLILKGCDGLGNRLYTLINAIEYCIKSNRDLFVDWSDNVYSNSKTNPFYDFFYLENFDNVKEIPILEKYDIYPSYYMDKLDKSISELYRRNSGGKYTSKIAPRFIPKGELKKIHSAWVCREGDDISINTVSDITGLKSVFRSNDIPLGGDYSYSLNQDIVVFADSIPDINMNFYWKYVRLKEKVVKDIIEVKNNIGISENTIGLHIRATDKLPNEDISKIFKYIDDNQHSNIFLATDSFEIEKLFKKKYKNIITYEKRELGTSNIGLHLQDGINKEEHLKEAIFDIWLLAECGVLLFQGNSSFSRFSSLLKKEINSIDWTKL